MFIALFLLLTACGGSPEQDSQEPGYNDDPVENEDDNSSNVPERKRIYKVTANMETEDLPGTIKNIRLNLEVDEWFDEENIQDDNAFFIIRVKSSRLDSFLASLSDEGTINNLYKVATDVSLEYYDKTSQIVTLEAERSRLLVLYEGASVNEMISLNSRIADIDSKIGKLQRSINEYDSLIDYSEIRLTIKEVVLQTETLSYVDKMKIAFNGGWSAFTEIVKFIFLVLIAVAPFIPIGIGIYFYIRYYNKKKMIKINNRQQSSSKEDRQEIK